MVFLALVVFGIVFLDNIRVVAVGKLVVGAVDFAVFGFGRLGLGSRVGRVGRGVFGLLRLAFGDAFARDLLGVLPALKLVALLFKPFAFGFAAELFGARLFTEPKGDFVHKVERQGQRNLRDCVGRGDYRRENQD